ncbi:MAG TPA: GGDEF domain-containing protein, partial [Spirochaetales bacterium]|nr:GGDEF domain-containing protein [Spirochaetales bacterium]
TAILGLLIIAITLLTLRDRERLTRLSTTDPLTGLYNRVTVRTALDRELGRLARYGSPLSVLMLDIDDFKTINDRFGHGEGDAVLKRLAGLMRTATRETDCVGRWGGEEFIVVLAGTPYEEAVRAAEKLRAAVAASDISDKRVVTVSVGVAGAVPEDTQESVVSRADDAMYRAKRSGKNRVEGSP